VFPLGYGIHARIHLAVQTTLITIFRPEAVFAVAQVRVPKVGGASTFDELHTVRIVVRRTHDVDSTLSIRSTHLRSRNERADTTKSNGQQSTSTVPRRRFRVAFEDGWITDGKQIATSGDGRTDGRTSGGSLAGTHIVCVSRPSCPLRVIEIESRRLLSMKKRKKKKNCYFRYWNKTCNFKYNLVYRV